MSDNYLPIMSSSVFLKVLEYCILHKIEPNIKINDRQQGFRTNRSTTTACLLLKETILNYTNYDSDVYACFVDISKAFDSVNHDILMKRLSERGVPELFVELVKYWYGNQMVCVKYRSHYSDEWKIGNGVRQGGILSGLFFSIYIDSLVDKISKMSLGCKLGIFSSNIIAYADDIVLIAPSFNSLQLLIDEAVSIGASLDLSFNYKKTKCMIFRSGKKTSVDYMVNNFKVNGSPVQFVYSIKYLGFLLSYSVSDDEDIDRVRCKFYSEFNSVLRNFNFADVNVKIFLFKQYCLQFYGCELWLQRSCSVNALKQFAVGYHRAIKKLLDISSHESNHYACQEAQLFTFQHFINKCKIMTAFRILSRPCNYFFKIIEFLSISSVFLREMYVLLQDFYGLDSILNNDKDAVIARIEFIQNREKQMRTHW